MTHLLGSKNCMDSLAQDVKDTQTAVEDVLDKLGTVHAQSWKFPDKPAAEIDIPELLEDYSHCKDAEYNRLAHIILFELVIDRLCFLIHGITQYFEEMLTEDGNLTEPSRPRSSATQSSVCVGLVVKKFWSKVVQVSLALQNQRQLTLEAIQQSDFLKADIDELKEDNSILHESIASSKISRKSAGQRGVNTHSAASSKSTRPMHSKEEHMISKFMSKSLSFVESKNSSEAATQTFETAFVPCEACARMQQNLLEVGATVISVCESQGLQSSLAKQKKMLRQSLMAAADVSRWAAEQSRDLQRINKHLDNLYAQINPLQAQLKSARDRSKSFEKQVQDCTALLNAEIQEKEELKVQLEQRAQDMNAQREMVLAEKNNMLKQLEALQTETEGKTLELKEELAAQAQFRTSLEAENKQLLQELEKVKAELSQLNEANAKYAKDLDELANLRNKVEEARREVDKTKAENSAISKHDKALQAKYDSLVVRVDELDEECDELQTTISAIEEEKMKLSEAVKISQSDKESIEKILKESKLQLASVSSEKDDMKKAVNDLKVTLETVKHEKNKSWEQLKLLASFPVIDERVPSDYSARLLQDEIEIEADDEDIPVQMERQITANNVRISILESQNEKLRSSLEKLRDFQHKVARELPKERIPLWHQETSMPDRLHDERSSEAYAPTQATRADKGFPNRHLKPIPPSSLRSSNSQRISEKRQAQELGARIASASRNPVRINSRGQSFEWENPAVQTEESNPLVAWTSNRPKSGRKSVSKSPSPMVSCPDCDRMYTTQRDLNIHRSFCYGRM